MSAGYELSIQLPQRITAYTASRLWESAVATLESHPDRPVVVDASQVDYLDNVGIALVFDLMHRPRDAGAQVEVRNLSPKLARLVTAFRAEDFRAAVAPKRRVGVFEQIGRATAQQAAYLERMARFIRDCAAAFGRMIRRPSQARWGEILDVATEAGANAVPIVLLVGFLMGIIIAFEIGLVARQFGAVIFVVNGVGVAMLRELGPLMTAIVFAGRTGAAFAAQIGTQKVNEEVNAIYTFGLSPVEFLVVPRLIAATLVVPLLAVLANIVGIFGGALVMAGFDVSFVQFYHQLLGAVTAGDFLLGVVKAAVFGFTIALIGCERGLSTGAGATSVGLSTTGAVVTSIVMIVVIDGLFTIFTS